MMRDLASCYNEHAVRVSDSSCSRTGSTIPTSAKADSSVHRSVTSFYTTKLSGGREFQVKVTWSRDLVGHGFFLGFREETHHRSRRQHLTTHRPVQHDGAVKNSLHLFRANKGSRSFVDSRHSTVEVHWDISSARYDGGPEPVGGFYVAVVVEGELGVRLGDMSTTEIGKLTADFVMIGRSEQLVGSSVYSTRSPLCDGGRDHDIQIVHCRGEGRDVRDSELLVCVDKREVVHVRRLRWNFRGHQTIFVDGAALDMMWDVHDWWFGESVPGAGCAVFMFRARGTLEKGRLWMEDEMDRKHEEEECGKASGRFSLVIHAFKATPPQ